MRSDNVSMVAGETAMDGPKPVATAAQEWRSHWRIVAGSAIGIATAYSCYSFVGSLFFQPLEKAFGWSRSEIAFGYNGHLVGIFSAPFLGSLADRIGVRKVLLTCTILLSLIYLGFSVMSGSLVHFYGMMLLQSAIGIGTTGLCYSRVISAWFSANRGTALAVARLGLAVSGALLPMLVFFSIERFGWQGGYYTLAAAAAFISLPIAWTWIQEPGRKSGEMRSPSFAKWLSLLRDPKVLLLCASAAFTIGPAYGLMSQFVPLLTGKGFAAATAAATIGVLSIAVFAGTLITGFLADRLWAPLIGCVFTLGPVIGCFLLFAAQPGFALALTAVILIGLAQGAETDLMAYLITRYRGMGEFSAILGLLMLVSGVATASGAVLFGWVYDRTGDYDAALIGAALCFLLGALSFLALGPYPKSVKD